MALLRALGACEGKQTNKQKKTEKKKQTNKLKQRNICYDALHVCKDPTDKDTKRIKVQSTGPEGYLEYTKENEKGKVNQLDVGNKKDQHNYKTRTFV